MKLKIAYLIFFIPFVLMSCVSNHKTSYQTGKASWYGERHHGKKTASGEAFNMNAMTAAHKTLPFGTKVKVVSKANNKSVIVRINDRGPFTKKRIIDVSKAAAQQLGMIECGEAVVAIYLL